MQKLDIRAIQEQTRAKSQKKLNAIKPKILNYLKSLEEECFICAVKLAGDLDLEVSIAKNVLFELEKEGKAIRDCLDKEKWKLAPTGRSSKEETKKQDPNLLAKEKANNTNSSLLLLPSDKTPSSSENSLKENTHTNDRIPISTFQEGNTTLAKVADLKEYPLNGKIYTGNNFAYLFPKIKES
ncbi:MAG: hypothetical protein QNJ54_28560, partial [Prochloraceae cyanobacterium]|nr:hypothetical protein [Prochloraceae cyanobacterium]